MNFFDKEIHIIEQLQMTRANRIRFLNFSFGLFGFFCSLYLKNRFIHWADSSGKNEQPPDFYSDYYKYMLEVMRFDDYQKGSNSPNAIESKRIEELNNLRRKNGLRSFQEDGIEVILNPDISGITKNSFELYHENFLYVLNKHSKNIVKYNENHPGYKLGFLLFDESPAYVETKYKVTKKQVIGGSIGPGRYYYAPFDKMFSNELLKLDIDYILWMTPFKEIPLNSPKGIIEVYLLDVKKARKNKKVKHFNYKHENLVCLEID